MGNKLRKQRLQSDSSSSSIQSSCSNEKEKSDFCWSRGRGRDVGNSSPGFYSNSTTLQSDSCSSKTCSESHTNTESFHSAEVPVMPSKVRSRTRQMQQKSGKCYLNLVQCKERGNQVASTSNQLVLSQSRVGSADDARPCEIKSNATTKHTGILCVSGTAVPDTLMTEGGRKTGSVKDKKVARKESLRPVICSGNSYKPLSDQMYCSAVGTNSLQPDVTYNQLPVLSPTIVYNSSVSSSHCPLFSSEIQSKPKCSKAKLERAGSLATRYGVPKKKKKFFLKVFAWKQDLLVLLTLYKRIASCCGMFQCKRSSEYVVS